MSALALVAFAAMAGAACSGGRSTADDRFGHRFDGPDDEGRETVLITAIPDSAAFLTYPAVVDSVSVRSAVPRLAPGQTTAVEVLVKGALPDACAELSGVAQRRDGRYVTVDLQMRTPRRRICAAVARPFRFYLPLAGQYEAGSYVLRLNGATHPFQVLSTEGPQR